MTALDTLSLAQRMHATRARSLSTAAQRAAAAVDALFDDFEPSLPACPACIGGEGSYLGTLGSRAHFRCRACGCPFSEVQS